MAYAGFRFAESYIKAMKGEKGIIEPTFVYLPGVEGGDEVQKAVGGLEWFAVPVELGVSWLIPLLINACTITLTTFLQLLDIWCC